METDRPNEAYKNKSVKFAVKYFQIELAKRDLRIIELLRKLNAAEREILTLKSAQNPPPPSA